VNAAFGRTLGRGRRRPSWRLAEDPAPEPSGGPHRHRRCV